MRNILLMLAIVAVGFAAVRRVGEGPNGEVIAAIALVGACVLLVGAAVLDRLDRLPQRPPDLDQRQDE